eukprot:TRINITY_DN858_c4_g1_i1.p1 TRINITY_DN858_c4_g1~~TRINITY_DN858_c4_g1_i1.p1  ORF type:complete len:322 (+),score=73.94 TRINITY_DN858_c4_g1_i1:431-1396(+)
MHQNYSGTDSPPKLPSSYWPRSVKLDVKFITGKVFSTFLPQGASLSALPHIVMKSFNMNDVTSLRFKDSKFQATNMLSLFAGSTSSLYYVVISAVGGKGGFGQILRAKGKNSTQQTTNFDACRTLDGQRVGVHRQLKAIELWGKGEDNADELTQLAVGSVSAAKARRDSRSQYKHQSKELTAKEKAELREQQVREGFEDQLKQSNKRVSGTLKAVSAGLKKKYENGHSYCPDGHPLEELLVGFGKNETGFDWNACDECDAICEEKVHRCSVCDFDICCDCKRLLTEEAKKVDTSPPKKKKKKKSAFDHDLSDDSSDEQNDD